MDISTLTDHFSAMANEVFARCVADYHITDSIDAPAPEPYPKESLRAVLYANAGLTPPSGTWKTSSETPT